ncbi:MAG TPA: hypothetical protein PLH57_04580 [Oligoflexia bacterium]|nr:hypothetical protein [Oligoflexia bacterium]
MEKRVNLVLWNLVLLDVVIATVALGFPEVWCWVFHGSDWPSFTDPYGLLRRTGASWAAFAIFQTLAALRWKREPFWLVLVAGLRLGEIFTDWIYLGFASSAGAMTWFGAAALFISPPANAWIGYYLVGCYRKLSR